MMGRRTQLLLPAKVRGFSARASVFYVHLCRNTNFILNPMTKIKNIDRLSVNEINDQLERGGKFVVFTYCFSIIVMTFRRSSDIYFVRAGESTLGYRLIFSLISFLFGWWGIPWGPVYSISTIFSNLMGGKDVTQDVVNSFNSAEEV